MISFKKSKLALVLFFTIILSNSFASGFHGGHGGHGGWHGGGWHGGGWHGGGWHGRGWNNVGWYGAGLVGGGLLLGAPYYYNNNYLTNCPYVQVCDLYGNCVWQQRCY